MKTNFHQFYVALLWAFLLLSACTTEHPAPTGSPVTIQNTPVIASTATPSTIPTKPSDNTMTPSETPTLQQGTGGTLLFPGTYQMVHSLVIDDQYVYFSLGRGNILRQTLDKTWPYQPELFSKNTYPDLNTDGSLRVFPRLLKDHWLYFVDIGNGTTTSNWTLRAIHTVTRSEKMIAQGNGCFLDFNVDDDTIAVSITADEDPNCVGENILETIQFSSGKTHEVDRSRDHSWLRVTLSGDRLLALQVPSNQQKGINAVVFDLKSGHSDLLSKVLPPSEPFNGDFGLAISGPWIACNINETDTLLYHLTTHQRLSFTELNPSDMSNPGLAFRDRWLYWTGNSKGNIYDLEHNKMRNILTPKFNEYIREMAVYDTKAAWLMLGPSGYVIGWLDIPQD